MNGVKILITASLTFIAIIALLSFALPSPLGERVAIMGFIAALFMAVFG